MRKAIIGILILLMMFLTFSVFNENLDSSPRMIDVVLTTYFEDDNIIDHEPISKEHAEFFSFDDNIASLEGYEFAYWILNGIVRRDLPVDHQFAIRSIMNLQAFFVPEANHLVSFMDANGILLEHRYVDPGESVEFTGEYPDRPFYDVAEHPWGEEATLDDIQANDIFILRYVRDTDMKLTLTLNTSLFGSDDHIQPIDYDFNDFATVEPLESYIDEFSYWYDGETGDILSYEEVFSFSMLRHRSVKAKYGEVVTVEPLVTISDDLELRKGYYVSHLAQFYLPEGYTLIEYGMIATAAEFDNITLETEGINFYLGDKYVGTTNEFLMSLGTQNNTNPRAYIIYRDALGNVETMYSDYKVDLIVEREYETMATETMVRLRVQNPDGSYLLDYAGYEGDAWMEDSRSDGIIEMPADYAERIDHIMIDGVLYPIDAFIDTVVD